MLATRAGQLPDCRPLLADPDDLTLLFEPIVALAGAEVAGFAASARFPGTAGADVWFAAARAAGLGADVETLAVHRALDALPGLPAGTFLLVHVGAQTLGSAPLHRAFADRADLTGLAVHLHGPIPDLTASARAAAVLRERGAAIVLGGRTVEDAGLRSLAALRPELVTLHRSLLDGEDPLRTALAEMITESATCVGAGVLAEDVETPGELASCVRLGVRLARGWLLGRSTAGFAGADDAALDRVRAATARAGVAGTVAGLLRPVRQIGIGDALGIPPAVLVGPAGEPLALVLADRRTGEVHTAPVGLTVPRGADVVETLARALARPTAQRFDPVVCTDPAGTVLGVLRIEDLAAAG